MLLQAAYARLTLENTSLKAEHARHMAEAENAASDRRVSYEGHMAKAKQDAGGMKVSLTLILLQKRAIPSHLVTFHACGFWQFPYSAPHSILGRLR